MKRTRVERAAGGNAKSRNCSFEEDEATCRISVPVSLEVVARDVHFKLRSAALTLGLKGCEPFISDEVLSGRVDVEESTWEITSVNGQRSIVVELCKQTRSSWGQPFQLTAASEDNDELHDRLDSLQRSPQSVGSTLHRLHQMVEEGQHEEAFPIALEMLGMCSHYIHEATARCILVECYWKQSRLLEALKVCAEFDNPVCEGGAGMELMRFLKVRHAEVNFAMGSYAECIRDLREFLAAHPNDQHAKYMLATALQSNGETPEALRLHGSVLLAEDASQHMRQVAAYEAGVCAASMGRHREAERFFAQVEDVSWMDFLVPARSDEQRGARHASERAALSRLINALCLGDAELVAAREGALLGGTVVVIGDEQPEPIPSWNLIASTSVGAAPTPAFFYCEVQLLQFALSAAHLQDGLVLEFGVFYGSSLRTIAGCFPGEEVHGFDCLTGLPEPWNELPAGKYSTQGALPISLPNNARMHVGLFRDTLPAFLEAHPGQIRFMNVDCDLYSSTKDIFDRLSDRIVPGTVIHFDEYIMVTNWQEHEYKAFQEAVTENGWTFEYLTFAIPGNQAVVRITGVDAPRREP